MVGDHARAARALVALKRPHITAIARGAASCAHPRIGRRASWRDGGERGDPGSVTPPPTEPAAPPAMSVRGAAFLGIGSMVGAGIFALLGEAGAVAGAGVWLSFLLAG